MNRLVLPLDLLNVLLISFLRSQGEAMAHLVATGESPHVHLRDFDPARMGIMDMVPQL